MTGRVGTRISPPPCRVLPSPLPTTLPSQTPQAGTLQNPLVPSTPAHPRLLRTAAASLEGAPRLGAHGQVAANLCLWELGSEGKEMPPDPLRPSWQRRGTEPWSTEEGDRNLGGGGAGGAEEGTESGQAAEEEAGTRGKGTQPSCLRPLDACGGTQPRDLDMPQAGGPLGPEGRERRREGGRGQLEAPSRQTGSL